ncbi:MAG: hypothetical protein R2747_01740 [Pyrinomonadaceae bacterium]
MNRIKRIDTVGWAIRLAVILVFGLAAGLVVNSVIDAQNRSDGAKRFDEQKIGAEPESGRDDDDDDDACGRGRGPTADLGTAKFFIEHNSTDEDTGVHGLFDGIEWQRLCVYDPRGRLVLDVQPRRQLRTQSISGIFFESAEPPNDEVPIEEILDRFPEGRYTVRGQAANGRRLRGSALFTHAIPAGPVIIHPQEGDQVPSSGLAIMWNHVTTTIDGEPFDRTGYQVIITKESNDDPNGFSRPVFDVHVPPTVTSLTVPNEFLEPGTEYELEVLVLEASGNQTISVVFFETE